MQYVMVIEIPDVVLDGDESIENASSLVNDALTLGTPGYGAAMKARPLSETIAC